MSRPASVRGGDRIQFIRCADRTVRAGKPPDDDPAWEAGVYVAPYKGARKLGVHHVVQSDDGAVFQVPSRRLRADKQC